MTAHRVREYMTTAIVTVHVSETLESVVTKMRQHAISGCPVVDPSGKLVGVISEVDLARVLSLGKGATSLAGFIETLLRSASNETLDPLAQLMHRFRHLRAGSCMTSPAITVGPEDPVSIAAALMGRRHINRLPVVSGGRLVGMLARGDLLEALAEEGSHEASPVAPKAPLEVLP